MIFDGGFLGKIAESLVDSAFEKNITCGETSVSWYAIPIFLTEVLTEVSGNGGFRGGLTEVSDGGFFRKRTGDLCREVIALWFLVKG